MAGKRFLVLGIGGAGDIVGATPTANMLRCLGAEVVLGGLTWERFVVDPKPGPRRIDELEKVERITRYSAYVNSATRIVGGIAPQLARASEVLGERLLAIDVSGGARGVSETLKALHDRLGIESIVGVDVGGDVLARGSEKGLRSPLADAIMLAGIANSGLDSVVGVIGIGCDGELTVEEISTRLSEMAGKGAFLGAFGITQDDLKIMQRLLGNVTTEVGRMVMLAAMGARGEFPIRDGTRKAHLSIFSSITFYLDAKLLYDSSPLAKTVSTTTSVEEASRALNRLGLKTELDIEYEAQRKGAKSYRDLFTNEDM